MPDPNQGQLLQQFCGLPQAHTAFFPLTQAQARTAAAVFDAPSSDNLPPQPKAVSATGQVVAGPCTVQSIRCTAGTAVTLVLRDSVTQNQADTDTTSPQLASLTMTAGDIYRAPVVAAFGLHATLGGAGPAFELEF